MERKRLIWADSVKGYLIILVVLGHAIQLTLGAECNSNHLWNLIYSFHMPAFMAVSGYLSFRPINENRYHNSFKSLVYRRLRQLIVPFLVWTFILVLLNSRLTWDSVKQYLLYPDKGLWFLWVLFAINLLFIGVNCLSEILQVKQEYVILPTCLSLVSLMVFFEPRIFGFQFIAYYFLFYALGYFLNKYKALIISNSIWFILVLVICWFLLAWFWKMHDIPTWLQFIRLPKSFIQYVYRFTTAVIAVYIIISLSPSVLNEAKPFNKFISILGSFSLGIYTTHFVLIGRIVEFSKSLITDESVTIILSCIIGLSASLLIVWLLRKWQITARLFLGKV